MKVKMSEWNMCKTNQVGVDSLKSVNMAGDVIEIAEMFCYLGDSVCTEGGVHKVVTSRIGAG